MIPFARSGNRIQRRPFFPTLLMLFHLTLTSLLARAEFTDHFRAFLDSQYGRDTRDALERVDMGLLSMGSFGGKSNGAETLMNRPVVFVHGVMLRAGAFIDHREFFMKNGYSASELYATTYGDGGLVNNLFTKKMECSDVKQIRNFIVAVSDYTQSKVDIVAYSMGVAISRKAILGGQCVDTLEDLGAPLTDLIDTYVGVAGVAYGFESCAINEKTWPSCNSVNGMVCTSKFMRDINSPAGRYEGTQSYAIFSTDDNIVGRMCCGKPCSEIQNANLTVTKRGYDHGLIFSLTKELQYSLIKFQQSTGL